MNGGLWKDQNCQIKYAKIPEDSRVKMKQDEKVLKYQDLTREVWRMWGLKTQVLIPAGVEWTRQLG